MDVSPAATPAPAPAPTQAHLDDDAIRTCFISDAARSAFELRCRQTSGFGFIATEYFHSLEACRRYFDITGIRRFLQTPAATIPDGAAPSRVEQFYHNANLAVFASAASLCDPPAPLEYILARNAIYCMSDDVLRHVRACAQAKHSAAQAKRSVAQALHSALVMRDIANAVPLDGEADMIASVVATIASDGAALGRGERSSLLSSLATYARAAMPRGRRRRWLRRVRGMLVPGP